MEQALYKDSLSNAIGDSTVKAVIVHSFNFDPVFFENYIMPVFVKTEQGHFNDNQINNSIRWRQLAKDNGIPPIAVYCDFYAKSNTHAPSLGYDVFCLKTPAAPHKICNFHPKLMLVLCEEKGSKEEKLILQIGSGNMTINGWCDNIECFTIRTIKQDKAYPNSTTKNNLQDYLNTTNEWEEEASQNLAFERIDHFLRKVTAIPGLYHSINSSLKDFLAENIPLSEVTAIEIISPYFSEKPDLLAWLQAEGAAKIYALLPTLKSNEITISENAFDQHTAQGLRWCHWRDESMDEVRNLHAKLYRFYTPGMTYTFLGSANFTIPGWGQFDEERNVSNIETGWLYQEQVGKEKAPDGLLKAQAIDKSAYTFIPKENLENNSGPLEYARNAPDLHFMIDWEKGELRISNREKKHRCKFDTLFEGCYLSKGENTIELAAEDKKKLAKSTLIKVVLQIEDREEVYCYYAQEINFQFKPLGFRVDTYTILKFWETLGNDYQQARLVMQLSDEILGENGTVDESKTKVVSLLNDMARHFYALTKLEHFLTRDYYTIKSSEEQLRLTEYYLLSSSLDTLPKYLEDLKEKLAKEEIQKSFYWMVLQIVNKNFYQQSRHSPFLQKIDKEDKKRLLDRLDDRSNKIMEEAQVMASQIPHLDKNAVKWIIKEI